MPIKIFFFTVIAYFTIISANAQRILQLEISKEVSAKKFYEGDEIVFKTSDYPKDWQKKVIEKILVEDNVILFDDRMVAISDITHFRMYNGSAKGVGSVLSGFGAGWLLFGGIAHFASDNTFTWSTFAIGTTASVLGWILRKFISKKTYKMGKSANLRALDVSFPAPHEVIIQRT